MESNSEEKPSEEDLLNWNCEQLEDQKNKSIIWAIIKQIKLGAEVKHLQLPTFVLQPRSLLEKFTDSFLHPDITLRVSEVKDPEERFLAVLQFYFSGWHIRPKGVRNPLNPILGEIFRCKWEHKDGTTTHFFAEQLSHHPPRSAFIYYNTSKGIVMNADIAPTYVKFFGNSAETILKGLLRLYVCGDGFEEIYEMTYPNMRVKGILFGTLILEVFGTVTFTALSSGYTAEVEFKSKSMFRGKYNEISGVVKDPKKKTIYTISGFWDDVMTLTDKKTKKTRVLFDPKEHPIEEKIVPPRDEQAPNESRRMWEDVVRGMLKNDEEEALSHKRKMEAVQRAAEQERKDKKIEWIPTYFKKDSKGGYVYHKWDELVEECRKYRQQKP